MPHVELPDEDLPGLQDDVAGADMPPAEDVDAGVGPEHADDHKAAQEDIRTRMDDAHLQQACLSIQGGKLELTLAPPPSCSGADEAFGDAPPGADEGTLHKPARHTPIHEHFGAEADPVTGLLPGEHRVCPAPVTAAAADDCIPEVDIPLNLAPLDAYLLAGNVEGDGPSAADVHTTAASASVEAPIYFGAEGTDDEGNGWLGEHLEEHLGDASARERPDDDGWHDYGWDEGEPLESKTLQRTMFEPEQLRALQEFLVMRARGGEGDDMQAAGEAL